MGPMGRMGMMGAFQVPPYATMLLNGRPPNDPFTMSTTNGQRLRLRLLNPSGATSYRVALGGHRLIVTHTDGRPVEPREVDALYIGMGERYDVVVETRNPGIWPLVAASVEAQFPPAQAVLRYREAAGSTLSGALPEGIQGGEVLRLGALHALDTPNPRRPDRRFDLVLSGGMMGTAWMIDGQAYPSAEPLRIQPGEMVGVRMVNHSVMIHPMHLHGHFFRTHDVFKDTVMVWPHMGTAAFDFVADNPGDWFFHCHNVYHLEAGMARVVEYA
jgi:FtsP/CotA-like multicopper oxidase with cupredoxin domain